MAPTIAALRARGGTASVQAINDAIADALGLDATTRKARHEGKANTTELAYRSGRARAHMTRHGVVEGLARGTVALTWRGRSMTDDEIDKMSRASFNSSCVVKLTA